MRRAALASALLTVALAAAAGAFAAAQEDDPAVARAYARSRAGEQDWLLAGAAGPVRNDGWWTLRNLTNGRPVVYGDRSFGINLVWGDADTAPNIHFVPAPEDRNQEYLRTNRPVAIQVAGGKYLKYGDRSFGINLVWSSTPVYEWEIHASGLTPRAVETGAAIGLYNRTVKKAVVYCSRDYGINLGWANDCGQFDKAARADVRLRIRVPSAYCEGTVKVRFTPLAVSGDGKRTPFVLERVHERRPEYPRATHWPTPAIGVNPNDWFCVEGVTAERLAAGRWRVTVDVPSWYPNPRHPAAAGPWSISCLMTVTPGKPEKLPVMFGNNLRLTYDRNGCGSGNTWPY